MRNPIFFIFGLFAFSSAEVLAEDFVLPPVVVNVAPGFSNELDTRMTDPVQGEFDRKLSTPDTHGSVTHDLQNHLPLPVTDQGAKPGNNAQFRGLGQSTEDNSVETLGIPLSPPQGGGYDFSVFPQFLWGDVSFQAGPAYGSLEPRAVAGSIHLTPWTAIALEGANAQTRFTQFYSSQNLSQTSVGTALPGTFAALLGYSAGPIRGPTGSASSRLFKNDQTTLKFHLLGSSIATTPDGSIKYPTPEARQQTSRLIPVAQLWQKFDPSVELRSSAFFDWGTYRYDDLPHGSENRTRSKQAGFQNFLKMGDGKLGASLRTLSVSQMSRFMSSRTDNELKETNFVGSAAYDFYAGDFLIEPVAQVVAASDFGAFPEGSLGFRRGPLFSRFSYSRKFPSLTDRFFNSPDFVGNSDLQPEKDYTFLLGGFLKEKLWETSLQLTAQWRDEVHTTVPLSSGSSYPTTKRNLGSASVYSAMHSISFSATSWADFSHSANLAYSEVHRTKKEFPYLPRFTDLAVLEFHSTDEQRDWSFKNSVRSVTSAQGASRKVGGFAYYDVMVRKRNVFSWGPGQSVELALGVENVFNRKYEAIEDFPAAGRLIYGVLTSQF